MALDIQLVITPGEPAGIGPDLCVMLAQHSYNAALTVVTDYNVLKQRAALLGLPLVLNPVSKEATRTPTPAGTVNIIHVPCDQPVVCGQPDPANAAAVLGAIKTATKGCLDGHFDALVTGPVNKAVINEAGIPFTGHTEYLAELTNAKLPVMMLATPHLRVALVTTHLPIADISRAITATRLEQTLRILHRDMNRYFGIANPRILVCGLNPHAGEGGHLGREEIEVIEPVLETLRTEGMLLTGPLSADTLFTPDTLGTGDVVLAMYHDQGLPVLKHVGFGQAVNITLGLPIIRTSVDHGSALTIAGTGKASVTSVEAALNTAIDMVRLQQRTQ